MLKLSPDRPPTNAVIVVMGEEPEVRLWCDEKDKLPELVRLGMRVKAALEKKPYQKPSLVKSSVLSQVPAPVTEAPPSPLVPAST